MEMGQRRGAGPRSCRVSSSSCQEVDAASFCERGPALWLAMANSQR